MDEAIEPIITGDENAMMLLGIMLRPDDPVVVAAELSLWTARTLGTDLSEKFTSAATQVMMTEYLNGRVALSELGDASKAQFAGITLLMLHWMHSNSVEEPSLKKAQWLSAKIAATTRRRGEHKKGFSISSLRSYWRDYKRVAHLWAAHDIMKSSPLAPDDLPNQLTEMKGEFLGIAKAIQVFADSYTPTRERNDYALLPPDTWRIAPAIKPFTLDYNTLSAGIAKDLAAYQHS